MTIHSHLVPEDVRYLLIACVKTLQMSLSATVIGTALGIILGLARSESTLARIITSPFVDIIRSVPMIIQLIIVDTLFSVANFPLSAFQLGTLALGSWMAAVTSETVRSAHEAVPASLRRAARALGMSFLQEIRFVGFPLMLRSGFPSWVNSGLSLVKDSALLGMFGYIELTKASQILNTRTHQTFLIFCLTGCIYFALCYGLTILARHSERRMNHD